MRFLGIRRVTSLAVAAVVTLATIGCGDDRVTVAAASSLRAIAHDIAPDARVTIGGSGLLAAQIRHGARIDLILSADKESTSRLHDEGLVERPIPFATNSLVVVVSDESRVRSLRDLAASDTALVIGAPSVPVGRYGRLALDRLGLADALDNVVSNEDSVAGVLAKVRSGDADAGIVYVTDASASTPPLRRISIPSYAQPDIVYTAAVVAGARYAEDAQARIEQLMSPHGQTILRSAGFGPPRRVQD